jgi:hypothetical protein
MLHITLREYLAKVALTRGVLRNISADPFQCYAYTHSSTYNQAYVTLAVDGVSK